MAENLQSELWARFRQVAEIQEYVKEIIIPKIDDKSLESSKLLNLIGEAYVKILLGGQLIFDPCENEVETPEGWLVSVNTKKTSELKWKLTSSIPRLVGSTYATHLAFVQLYNDYWLNRIWLFEWKELREQYRLKDHVVPKQCLSYIFSVNEKKDDRRLIYKASANPALQIITSSRVDMKLASPWRKPYRGLEYFYPINDIKDNLKDLVGDPIDYNPKGMVRKTRWF